LRTAASHLGLPDAGLAIYNDRINRVNTMSLMAKTPLVVDGDTGNGGLLNKQKAVFGSERAGAVAIEIEDQEFPNKCGHTLGRRFINMNDMVQKIKVAFDVYEEAGLMAG